MAIVTRLEILKESVDTVVRRSQHCDPLIDNLIMQGTQTVVREYNYVRCPPPLRDGYPMYPRITDNIFDIETG